MSRLRVLLVEDHEDDARLVARALHDGGFDVEPVRVETREQMTRALDTSKFDVVIADHSLPTFSSTEALKTLHMRGEDLPFLIVSGSIPEDLAVSAMRSGAHDFLTKDRLARLVPAVQREIREARNRAEHRESQRRLTESEERYRRFFEDAVTGNALALVSGELVDCNEAFVRMFRFPSREAALATNLVRLFADPGVARTTLAELRREQRIRRFDGTMRGADDAPIQAVGNVSGEFDASGRLTEVRLYLFDVTERLHLEAQLRQSQRMEAVGRLAGGVAHDFNNVLTAIAGYTDLAIQGTPDGPVAQFLGEVRKASERAAWLTRRLLAFSRKQVQQPEILDLNAVLKDLEGMLRRLIGEDVWLEIAPDAASLRVVADRGSIEQVVMNLVVNSRDALPAGGRIGVTTHRVFVRPDETAEVPPGDYAVLVVSDDGTGMDEDVKRHLFEPFFTTKEPGKGTGLGLATVRGIVDDAKGHVRFDSEVGKGTEFRVYFARTEAALPVAHERPRASSGSRTETVLLVEDDASVRQITRDVLRAYGYRVLEAHEGLEALRISREHPGPIDVLITDVVMPGMYGPDVAACVLAARPRTKVLFISGYSGDAIGATAMRDMGAALLGKPFGADQLVARLETMLDEPSEVSTS